MRFIKVLFTAVFLVLPLPSQGADTYEGVEYISGKDKFEKKIKGILHIDVEEIRFTDKKGRPIFTIPHSILTEVSTSSGKEEGSFGRKMALGIFASKNQDYLYINTETKDTAEGLVFKCKKNTSQGMAAELHFYMKRASAANTQQTAEGTQVSKRSIPTDEHATTASVPAGALPPAQQEVIPAGPLPPAPLATPTIESKRVGWTTRENSRVAYEWQAVLGNRNSKPVQVLIVLRLHSAAGNVIYETEEWVSYVEPDARMEITGTGVVQEVVALQADHWTLDISRVQVAGPR